MQKIVVSYLQKTYRSKTHQKRDKIVFLFHKIPKYPNKTSLSVVNVRYCVCFKETITEL